MTNLVFYPDGITLPENGKKLNFDESCQVYNAMRLYYVMEDLRSHCAERYEGGGVDENGDWLYDKEKYTDETLRSLAETVLEREEFNEAICDAHWFVIDWVLDDYDEKE